MRFARFRVLVVTSGGDTEPYYPLSKMDPQSFNINLMYNDPQITFALRFSGRSDPLPGYKYVLALLNVNSPSPINVHIPISSTPNLSTVPHFISTGLKLIER